MGCCHSKQQKPPVLPDTLDRIDRVEHHSKTSTGSKNSLRPRSGESLTSSESMPNATLIPRQPSVVLDNVPAKWRDSVWCKPKGKNPRAYEVKRKHRLTVTLSSTTGSMLCEQIRRAPYLDTLSVVCDNTVKTLGSLPECTDVHDCMLYCPQVTKFPSLEGWRNVRRLRLESEETKGLPNGVETLVNLTELVFVGGRKVQKLQLYFNNWSLLSKLVLHVPKLKKLPRFESASNLMFLELKSATIPSLNELTATQLSELRLVETTGLQSWSSEVSVLTTLTILYVEKCVEDVILDGTLSKLKNLQRLTIRECGLVSLPSDIGTLTELTDLCLVENKLAQLPPSLSTCTKLKSLKLSRNQLKHLPQNCADAFPILQELEYDDNQWNMTALMFKLQDFDEQTEQLSVDEKQRNKTHRIVQLLSTQSSSGTTTPSARQFKKV